MSSLLRSGEKKAGASSRPAYDLLVDSEDIDDAKIRTFLVRCNAAQEPASSMSSLFLTCSSLR